jgi:hypothetical protein
MNMAKNFAIYVKNHPSRLVIVLAGSGDSWKKGIPEQLRCRVSTPVRVPLPEMPGRLQPSVVTTQGADYLWLNLTR